MTSGNLYLAVAIIGALNTMNGYRPFARSGFASLPVIAGMLTTELPLQTVAFQALGSVVLVWAGALESATGVAALVVSLVSWVALTGLHRDAQRSRDVLEQSRRAGLGDDYASRIQSRLNDAEGRPHTRRHLMLPTRGARKRYCSTRDLAYGDAGKRNELDVWRRPDLAFDGSAPVLLQIHGGAWVMGRQDDHAGPPLTLTRNAHEFQPGFEDADKTVQAAMPMYGLHDLTNRSDGTRHDTIKFVEKKVFKSSSTKDAARWDGASPICHMRAYRPPFLVVHGSTDSAR